MEAFIGFAAVVMTTIVALFSALALQALLLRATIALMQPAAAGRRPCPVPHAMERGAQMAARAYQEAR